MLQSITASSLLLHTYVGLILMVFMRRSATVTSTSEQCPVVSISFLNLEPTGQGNYSCESRIVHDESLKLCHNQTIIPGLAVEITKDNEGLYSCCCGDCQSTCLEEVLYGEQILNDSISSTLEVEWGAASFSIQCPYTPGRLIEESSTEYYSSRWLLKPIFKSGSITLYPLASGVTLSIHFFLELDRKRNVITAAQPFNPIKYSGTYKCGLSLVQDDELKTDLFDITVTTKKSQSITTASIKTPPKSLVVSSEDKIAQFNCIAALPTFSSKSIGFNITNLIINSSQTQSIMADVYDDNCVSDDIMVNCTSTDESLSLECSYEVPYEVGCKLTMKNLTEKSSSRITCFVVDSDVTSNPVNLFITMPCGLSSCPDGYTLNSTSCTCTLTDICVADNPCNNNGVCTLRSSPDNFTCDCTGTGFMGLNCTDGTKNVMTVVDLSTSQTHSGQDHSPQKHSLTLLAKSSSVTITQPSMTIISSNQAKSSLNLIFIGIIVGLLLLVLVLILVIVVGVHIHLKTRHITSRNGRQDHPLTADHTTEIRAGSSDESSLTVQANPNPIYDYVSVDEYNRHGYDDTVVTPIVNVTKSIAYSNTVGHQHQNPSYLQTEEHHDEITTPTVIADNAAFVSAVSTTLLTRQHDDHNTATPPMVTVADKVTYENVAIV